MRQKFLIQKTDKNSDLNIKEFANLDREYKFSEWVKFDKEFFSLICEETYDKKLILSAIKKGKESLILTMRTPNMYPIGIYAEQIANSIIELYDSKKNQTVELLFDDKEFFERKIKMSPDKDNAEEKSAKWTIYCDPTW